MCQMTSATDAPQQNERLRGDDEHQQQQQQQQQARQQARQQADGFKLKPARRDASQERQRDCRSSREANKRSAQKLAHEHKSKRRSANMTSKHLASFLLALLVCAHLVAPTSGRRFTPPADSNQQAQAALLSNQFAYPTPFQLASGATGASASGAAVQQVGALERRCRIGAPLQWRSYLDAASKAYLAPAVALAKLKQFNMAPIQLGAARPVDKPTGPLLQLHAQSVNNAGVLIEATFLIQRVPKQARSAELRPGQLVNVHYKVSASLSTTSDIIALASSETNRTAVVAPPAHVRQLMQRAHSTAPNSEPCALDLTEAELVRKGSQLFRANQDYVLFLEPLVPRRAHRNSANAGGARYQQMYGASQEQRADLEQVNWHPFASHEALSNQTSRSIHKILCANCARAPTVQLVNSTFVSSLAHQQRPPPQPDAKLLVRLDCRVTGNPAPWVEWFRNGKLLRNRASGSSGVRIRTSRVRRKSSERLSRLEVELRAGRNETGLYECRAMSVAAREPAVGAYTLLVLPERQFALIPMQQASGDSQPPTPPTAPPAKSATDGAPQPTNAQLAAQVQQQDKQRQQQSETATSSNTDTPTTPSSPSTQSQATDAPPTRTTSRPASESPSKGAERPSSKSSAEVVGQPCPREAHDNFCLNKGTCVLIGHIEEYFCNCAEGYHGHRCEYKSLGHQQATH